MAVRRNDNLAKTLIGTNTDSRFINWLWLFIKLNSPQENLGEFRSHGMRDRMAEFIKQEPQRAKIVEERSAAQLLPEQNFQWIKNNKRQSTFIIRSLSCKNGGNYIDSYANLTHREMSIAAIDILQIGQVEKMALVSQLAVEWQINTQSDQLFKWFDGTEEKEKAELAFELITKKFSPHPSCEQIFQTKEDILIYFDNPKFSAPEKEIFVTFVKKRWSQNKYRSKNTGKKQYNFMLPENAIKRLDKLADKHGVKRTQILEILLQMEEEKGIYISERLKVLRNI